MSNLFNGVSYVNFSVQHHGSLKKQMENRLEAASQTIGDDLHSLEGQEDPLMDGVNFVLINQEQSISLPNKLLQVESLDDLLSMEVIQENFTNQEMDQLKKFLPEQNIEQLKYVFTAKNLNGLTHLQNFQKQLKKGHFTLYRQRQDEINQMLNQNKLKQIYVQLFHQIMQRNERPKLESQKHFVLKNEESQVESIQDLPQRGDFSQNSQATETQQQNNVQEFDQYPQEIYYRYDYTKIKHQQQLLSLGEDKGQRKVNPLKNIITVKPRNAEWVQNFRKQQYQRYANPTKPWIYVCEDGRKVTVAPVAKKISVLTGKPRFHPMLKMQRPACVTILTLARDAAARLPNGVGTRADICELVKQSQFITEDLSQDKLSSTISGALDRLHYMSDACVKYDSEKKLWIYLHIDRSHEHPGWGDDGEQYTEKNSTKKKK